MRAGGPDSVERRDILVSVRDQVVAARKDVQLPGGELLLRRGVKGKRVEHDVEVRVPVVQLGHVTFPERVIDCQRMEMENVPEDAFTGFIRLVEEIHPEQTPLPGQRRGDVFESE